jgi:hypothetical protein
MFFHKVTLAIMHIEIFCRCTFFVCAFLLVEIPGAARAGFAARCEAGLCPAGSVYRKLTGLCPGSGSAIERLGPLRLRRSLRLHVSKKFLALHSAASPPDVRQGYALPEAFIEN